MDNIQVKVNVVGHASPRWRGAKNPIEASKLNQALSEVRARNVQAAVAGMLKHEMPVLTIQVPAAGVGSSQLFPTASETNAAVDRSVVVTIDIVSSLDATRLQPRPPRKIYAPSDVWTFRVLDMARLAGVGGTGIFFRISLENPYTGKAAKFSGWLGGGNSVMDIKDSFKVSKPKPQSMLPKPVGHKVVFRTKEPMDFDDWAAGGVGLESNSGIIARAGKVELKLGVKAMDAYMTFVGMDTKPDMFWFDHKLGLGTIGADAFLVWGILKMEGPNPGDYFEVASLPDSIPITHTHANNDGILITFPTGKSEVRDLDPGERQKLANFVQQKARNIGVLASMYPILA